MHPAMTLQKILDLNRWLDSTFNLEKQFVLEYMQEVNYTGQVEKLLDDLMNYNIELLQLFKEELGESE